MKWTKAKIIVAGLVLSAACVLAPQQLRAAVPEAQMDGVMGQSIEDETVYKDDIPAEDTQYSLLRSAISLLSATSTQAVSTSYTQDFEDNSFTTDGDYTSATYYHRSDFGDYQLVNGIGVCGGGGGS